MRGVDFGKGRGITVEKILLFLFEHFKLLSGSKDWADVRVAGRESTIDLLYL